MWFFFFFSSRRRHTRFDCDWSSDVCSSDLALDVLGNARVVETLEEALDGISHLCATAMTPQIGRASCRESVDLGGRRIIKKKKKKGQSYLDKNSHNRVT